MSTQAPDSLLVMGLRRNLVYPDQGQRDRSTEATPHEWTNVNRVLLEQHGSRPALREHVGNRKNRIHAAPPLDGASQEECHHNPCFGLTGAHPLGLPCPMEEDASRHRLAPQIDAGCGDYAAAGRVTPAGVHARTRRTCAQHTAEWMLTLPDMPAVA